MMGGKRIVVEVRGVRKGSAAARDTANQLTTELYGELHRSAFFRLSKHRHRETLGPTVLVHEVFMRFASDPERVWDRKQFMVTACKAMEQVIVDYARARLAAKRNGGAKPYELCDEDEAAEQEQVDGMLERAVAVHSVLERLSAQDEFAATVIRLRFFAGMPHGKVVAALGVSDSTVHRSFVFAKAWLLRELADFDEREFA